MYDEYAHNKSIWLFSLEEQHGDSRLFRGPLKLVGHFELPYPNKSSLATQDKLRDQHSTLFPTVSELVKLFGELATGILFNSDVIISSVIVDKRFSDEPCTYLIIEEVQDAKKEGK